MAPSGDHLLVPKAWRAVRFAVEKASRAIRDRFPQSSKVAHAELQPVYARYAGARHPIHRAAAIRQSQSRWYSTRKALASTIRTLSTAKQGVKVNRAAFPSSRTATAVNQLTSRTPFASTLRPNLTGGTLGRTAGGYGTGAGRVGGARYFSHGPAAPAEVVNNVSAAMRAFWLSGQRLQYDGSDRRTGQMRFKAVSNTQNEASRHINGLPKQAPGSYVDFQISPLITAVGALSGKASENTLNEDGLLSMLSADFARAFKDLSIVTNDLKKLSTIGDLSVTLVDNKLRVRFPGCDSATVEKLCDELGIQRGVVHEDPDFDAYHGAEMALLFPYAPSRVPSEIEERSHAPKTRAERDEVVWQNMLSPKESPSPGFSHKSDTSHDFEDIHIGDNPWVSSPSGYSSLHGSSEFDAADLFDLPPTKTHKVTSDYEGIQGIYRFLEECDRAKR